jgi:hypothetical protein
VLGVALLAALGGVVAGCGGSSDTGTASPAGPPVIESAAEPPGTDLGDGFTVVEGTTLVGDPIPLASSVTVDGEPVVDEGWVATSVVDGGDPMAIVEAYLAQAEQAGLAEQPGTGCALDGEVATCTGFARSPEVTEPRSVSATVVRGPSGDVLSDHVVVRYSTTDLYWDYGQVQLAEPDPDLALPGPTTWPPLPQVGDPLGTAGETTSAVVVQEGSRLAAPTRLNLDDATGGLVALIEVTGDPDAVLRAYVDHLTDLGLDAPTPEERQVGDATVTRVPASQAGGDHITLTLVERPGRPTWLEVDASHD